MRNYLTLIILLLVISVSFGQNTNYNSLKTQVDSLIKEHNILGMQLAVTNKDSVLFNFNYGKKMNTNEPITDQTLFNIASVTKSFTALGILMLVEEGKLSLNDKLSDIIPEITIENQWESTHPIKVVHLLEHTAGLQKIDPKHYVMLIADTNNQNLLTFLKKQGDERTLSYPPGTYYNYTNLGYTIAGYIIEKVSSMPYTDFMETQLFGPLGMHASTFNTSLESTKEHLAISTGEFPEYLPIMHDPAAGMLTNATDMVKYIQFHLKSAMIDSTQFITEKYLNNMYQGTHSVIGQKAMGNQYGMGFFPRVYKGNSFLLHTGGTPGFTSAIVFFPEREIGFFSSFMEESNETNWKLIDLLIEHLSKDINTQKDEELERFQSSSAVGYYRIINQSYPILNVVNDLFNITSIQQDEDGLYFKDGLQGIQYPIYIDKSGSPFVIFSKTEKSYLNFHSDINADEAMQMSNMSGKYLKVSPVVVWSKIVLFFACLLLLISTPLITSIRWICFRVKRAQFFRSKALIIVNSALLVFILCLVTLIIATSDTGSNIPISMWETMLELGSYSFTSVSVYIYSILFGLAGVSAFCLSMFEWRKIVSKTLKVYIGLVGTVFIITIVYLFQYGFIGFSFWE